MTWRGLFRVTDFLSKTIQAKDEELCVFKADVKHL